MADDRDRDARTHRRRLLQEGQDWLTAHPAVPGRTPEGRPLAPYGPNDVLYVLGPTGKWYTREEAKAHADVAVSIWLDQDWGDVAFPAASVVDRRWTQRNVGTEEEPQWIWTVEYLVKYPVRQPL